MKKGDGSLLVQARVQLGVKDRRGRNGERDGRTCSNSCSCRRSCFRSQLVQIELREEPAEVDGRTCRGEGRASAGSSLWPLFRIKYFFWNCTRAHSSAIFLYSCDPFHNPAFRGCDKAPFVNIWGIQEVALCQTAFNLSDSRRSGVQALVASLFRPAALRTPRNTWATRCREKPGVLAVAPIMVS